MRRRCGRVYLSLVTTSVTGSLTHCLAHIRFEVGRDEMLELSFMPLRLRSAVKFHSVCLVRSIEAFAFMFPKTCVHSFDLDQ